MAAPPFMPLWWGEYLGGTRHLRSAAQHGAYLLLIAALWEAGGKLPADDARLAALACCTEDEWAVLKPTILAFFRIRRGVLSHKRVDAELAKCAAKAGKAKAAGRAGGLAKARKNRENPEADAKQTPDGRLANRAEQSIEDTPEDKSSGVALDPDQQAWAGAVRVLMQQGGMKEPEARRFFGRLLSQHRDLRARDLLTATASAILNQTGDPKAYLTRVAQMTANRKAEGSRPRTSTPPDLGFV